MGKNQSHVMLRSSPGGGTRQLRRLVEFIGMRHREQSLPCTIVLWLVAVVDINIPSFSGQSYLQYWGLRRALLSYADLLLVFKATDPGGQYIVGIYVSLAFKATDPDGHSPYQLGRASPDRMTSILCHRLVR